MSDTCPFCECDPCDCGWGNYCGTEEGNIDTIPIISTPWWEHDGDDLISPLFASWTNYDDCLEHIQGLVGTGGFPGTYTGTVVLILKIGDPVKYFPNSDLMKDTGVWMVKDIINKHSLDCSWYDYEITNGSITTLCRQEEIFKLEVR
tara:strand:- start:707 stop:1147 length:441 start_codon:yes stop_codon:yes gene_type:complete